MGKMNYRINITVLFMSIIAVFLLFSCHNHDHDVHSIDVSQLKKIMSKEHQYTIVDVRTPAETANGKINGAIEIDVKSSDFEEQISTLDKSESYILYCRSGKRSTKAYHTMTKAGFKKLLNLEGGYLSYSADQ